MEDLMHQTQTQVIDFAESWRKASANGKQEIQFALYPRGLTYSHEKSFFEPSNLSLLLALQEAFATLIKFGVPDWDLNPCYRRESGSDRKLLKLRNTDGYLKRFQ
jgi:hypothetical protein